MLQFTYKVNKKEGSIMKFTFDYEETLVRRVVVDASCLSDAITQIEHMIENEEIVLGAEDFAGGEIRMPLGENFLPQLRDCGASVESKEDMDIVIDFW
jgi:hypothetical protein